ncbi:MAG: lipopolysaccharide biosynthesis protein [Burkholderiales bacterium]|nr:lipopolysaccharide biosynthesis protein [Burkholderiales bacterium]MBW8891225.1 lipopolysaccharide biosynthesis protein [Burkholderiales bacterium]
MSTGPHAEKQPPATSASTAESRGSLGRQIALSGLTLVLLRLSVRLIGLVSIVLLFRILAPEDFGLVATAMIVVGFVEIFAEFGFDQALLRHPNATEQEYHTTWTLNTLRGLSVCAVLMLGAPLAAKLLDDPRLLPILLTLAFVPLLDGVASTGVIEFARNLDFQKEFKLKVGQKLISFAVTLTAALTLRNYWALVIGTLAGRLAGVVMSYAMHPFRPRPSLHGAGEVLRFSSWQLANSIVLYLGNQTDKIATQKLFSASAVGILRVAEEVSSMVMEFVWPIERALVAGYTKLIGQQEELRRTVLSAVGCIAAVGVPLSVALAALADPAVRLILGEKGVPAIPFVQAFAIHGALRSTMSGIFPLFLTIGRPRINTFATFLSVAVRLASLLVLFPLLGVISAPYCLALGTMCSWIYVWSHLNRSLSLGWPAVLRILGRPTVCSLLLLGVGLGVQAALPGLGPIAMLAVAVPACVLTYVGSTLLLWRLAGSPAGPEAVFLHWLRQRRAPLPSRA